MAPVPQKYLGTMKNRELIRDTLIGGVAKNETIEAGRLCFYNSASGKQGWMHTTATILQGTKVRIAEHDSDNSTGEAGDKKITTWSGGIIAVAEVGDLTRSGEQPLRAGDPFINAAGGTLTIILHPSTLPKVDEHVGVVLGKVEDVDEHDIKAAGKLLATGDLVYVRLY